MTDAIDIFEKLLKRISAEAPQLMPQNGFSILRNLKQTLDDYERYRKIYLTVIELSARKGSITYDSSPIDDGLNYRVVCGKYRLRSVSLDSAILALAKVLEKEKKNG